MWWSLEKFLDKFNDCILTFKRNHRKNKTMFAKSGFVLLLKHLQLVFIKRSLGHNDRELAAKTTLDYSYDTRRLRIKLKGRDLLTTKREKSKLN